MRAEHALQQRLPNQVEVVLQFHFRGPLGAVVGRLYASLVRSYLATEAAALSARVRDGGEPSVT